MVINPKKTLFLVFFLFALILSGCGGGGGALTGSLPDAGGQAELNGALISQPGALDISDYFPLRRQDRFRVSNGDIIYDSAYMGEIDACGVRAVKLGCAEIFNLYYMDETGLYFCGNQDAVFDKKVKLSSKSPAINDEFTTGEISSGEVIIKAVSRFKGFENISTPPADFSGALKFEVTYLLQTVETEISRSVIYLARNAGPVQTRYFTPAHASPVSETVMVSGEAGGIKYSARKKKWSFFTYVCGRTDDFMSLAVDYELINLKYSGIESDMNFVTQFVADPKYSLPGRMYLKNSNFETAKLYENKVINTGDEYNMIDFLKWAAEMFPAEHYLISISGHGSGIISMDEQSTKDYRAPAYAVGYDDHSKDSLNLPELKRTCAAFNKETGGKKIDIFLFDACLMNMVEMACQFKDEVNYTISSMRTVTGYGMDLALFADKFKKLPDKSPFNVGKAMVDAYIDSNTLNGGNTNLCLTDLSKTDEFITLIDELAAAAIENIDSKNTAAVELIVKSINNASTSEDGSAFYKQYIDIFDLMVCIKNNFGPSHHISKLADNIFSFRDKINIYNRSDAYYQYNRPVKGFSIFVPAANYWEKYQNQYKAIDFGLNTKWPELMDKLLKFKAN